MEWFRLGSLSFMVGHGFRNNTSLDIAVAVGRMSEVAYVSQCRVRAILIK